MDDPGEKIENKKAYGMHLKKESNEKLDQMLLWSVWERTESILEKYLSMFDLPVLLEQVNSSFCSYMRLN